MSLKSILNELGVAHPHRYSGLFTNWYRELQEIQDQGLMVSPIRVGAKRVALALETEQRHSNYLPWLVGGTVLVGAVSWPFLFKQPSEVQNPHPVSITCSPLVAGLPIEKYGDWQFANVLVYSLGNLSQYKTVATCRDHKWNGLLVLVDSNGVQTIKKLTPTK